MPQPGVRAAAEIVEPGHYGHRSRHLKEQAAFHVVTLDGRGEGLWFQGNCRIVAAGSQTIGGGPESQPD